MTYGALMPPQEPLPLPRVPIATSHKVHLTTRSHEPSNPRESPRYRSLDAELANVYAVFLFPSSYASAKRANDSGFFLDCSIVICFPVSSAGFFRTISLSRSALSSSVGDLYYVTFDAFCAYMRCPECPRSTERSGTSHGTG